MSFIQYLVYVRIILIIRCLILQVTWWKWEEHISYQGPRSWVRDKMPDTAGDLVEGRGADLLPGSQVLGQR